MYQKRLQMRWDGNGAQAGVKRRVDDNANDRVPCFMEYDLGNLRLGGVRKKFYCAFTYFPLVEF